MKTKHSLLAWLFVFSLFPIGSVTATEENGTISTKNWQHRTVAAEKGKFNGWPANGGAWAWGDEILVVFKQGNMKLDIKGHLIDPNVRQIDLQARSLDGGRTWTIERDLKLETSKNVPVKKRTEPLDFRRDGFALMLRLTGIKGGSSYFFDTYDRGKTWNGPYDVPMFDEALISARTCTLIEGKHEMYAFLSGAPKTGEEFGTHVLLVHTKDGGMTWEKVSDVGDPSNDDKWSIMPSAVRISGNEIVCGIRYCDRSEKRTRCGIEIWGSLDNGKSWNLRNRMEVGSTPPTLEYLSGDRLALFYGNRQPPKPGIHVRLSRNRGKTWTDPVVVRDDGGSFDLGYTKNVFRADGKGILFYYYTRLDPNADRTIDATIWNPDDFK